MHPTDDPQYGPLINPRYKSFATERLNRIREELSTQGEGFLTDCGISKQDMLTDIPDHYRNLPPSHFVAPEVAHQAQVHHTMYQAYKKFRDIEADSVYAVRDQGVAEINLSLLGHHMNQELRKIHEVGGDTEKALGDIIAQVKAIEQAAMDHGSLQMLAAAIEILQKHKRVTNRLENLKRRYVPSIRCGSSLKFDMEGDGGSVPELSITYAGHMPYCGPKFGLACDKGPGQ